MYGPHYFISPIKVPDRQQEQEQQRSSSSARFPIASIPAIPPLRFRIGHSQRSPHQQALHNFAYLPESLLPDDEMNPPAQPSRHRPGRSRPMLEGSELLRVASSITGSAVPDQEDVVQDDQIPEEEVIEDEIGGDDANGAAAGPPYEDSAAAASLTTRRPIIRTPADASSGGLFASGDDPYFQDDDKSYPSDEERQEREQRQQRRANDEHQNQQNKNQRSERDHTTTTSIEEDENQGGRQESDPQEEAQRAAVTDRSAVGLGGRASASHDSSPTNEAESFFLDADEDPTAFLDVFDKSNESSSAEERQDREQRQRANVLQDLGSFYDAENENENEHQNQQKQKDQSEREISTNEEEENRGGRQEEADTSSTRRTISRRSDRIAKRNDTSIPVHDSSSDEDRVRNAARKRKRTGSTDSDSYQHLETESSEDDLPAEDTSSGAQTQQSNRVKNAARKRKRTGSEDDDSYQPSKTESSEDDLPAEDTSSGAQTQQTKRRIPKTAARQHKGTQERPAVVERSVMESSEDDTSAASTSLLHQQPRRRGLKRSATEQEAVRQQDEAQHDGHDSSFNDERRPAGNRAGRQRERAEHSVDDEDAAEDDTSFMRLLEHLLTVENPGIDKHSPEIGEPKTLQEWLEKNGEKDLKVAPGMVYTKRQLDHIDNNLIKQGLKTTRTEPEVIDIDGVPYRINGIIHKKEEWAKSGDYLCRIINKGTAHSKPVIPVENAKGIYRVLEHVYKTGSYGVKIKKRQKQKNKSGMSTAAEAFGRNVRKDMMYINVGFWVRDRFWKHKTNQLLGD